jgi:hypothetical protein
LHKLFHLFVAATAAFTHAAEAQDSPYGTSEYGGGWAVPSLDVSQSIIRDAVTRKIVDDSILDRNSTDASENEASRSSPPLADTTGAERLSFVASPVRRHRNYDRFLAESYAVAPGGTKFYEEMFRSNQYIERLDILLDSKGLESNNIADAFANYWISAWLASRGLQTPASARQAAATKTVAIEILSRTPTLTSMTDAEKQEVADDLFIKAGLLDGLMSASADNPAYLQRISIVARDGARKWGLDLEAMTLTDSGFVFKN